jgi:peptidoglycan lytic transglycosylase
MKRLLCLALVTAACARTSTTEAPPPPLMPAPPPYLAPPAPAAPTLYDARGLTPFQGGKATYYHDSLAGNPTASGERYDPRAMTAAHRSLPFGSIVDVVRRDGRWVRVRINDRGPYGRGRIIDLSRSAAAQVGVDRAGIADVTLYVVYRAPKKVSRRSAPRPQLSKR